MYFIEQTFPFILHSSSTTFKLQIKLQMRIMTIRLKIAFTLRIFSLIGYDMSTATVSLMLIKIKFLVYSSLSSGIIKYDP
jgi:hypothetical protein